MFNLSISPLRLKILIQETNKRELLIKRLSCLPKTRKMKLLTEILIGFIAFEHLGFLWLEMFAWETSGKKIFKGAFPPELFKPTRFMAANQGLYNGFLAAGLIWCLIIENAEWQANVGIFILGCIIVAGIFGAFTVSKRIFYIQALPAIIALALLLYQA